MFTIGFWAGAILSFRLFAAKKPEEEEMQQVKPATFVLINNGNEKEKQQLPQMPNQTPKVPANQITSVES